MTYILFTVFSIIRAVFLISRGAREMGVLLYLYSRGKTDYDNYPRWQCFDWLISVNVTDINQSQHCFAPKSSYGRVFKYEARRAEYLTHAHNVLMIRLNDPICIMSVIFVAIHAPHDA